MTQSQLRISQGDYGPIHDLPASGPQRLDLVLATLAKLVMEDPNAATDLIDHLGTGLLSPADLTIAQYYYHAWKGDGGTAQAYLDQLAGSAPEWQALADIQGILRQEALSGNQPWSISAASVNALSAMDAARGPYAELARQILHNKDIDHNFLYPDAPEALQPATDGPMINLQTEQLLLAPNPASQTVTATLVMELPEGARLSVVDMMGREIWAQSIDANHQQVEMDIHTWAKGIYQVAIRRPGQPTLQQKLVKN